MPIINLCKATDKGATGAHNGAGIQRTFYDVTPSEKVEFQGPTAYWTNLSHVGLCIKDFERNGHDDSDFFMVVWNAEKQEPETICFASTRGWSYPCYGSSADATPEVLAAYKAWGERMEVERKARVRREQANKLRELRNAMHDAATKYGVSYARLLKFRRTNADRINAVMWLLTANIRSGFKLSMRNQVIAWLRDPAPRYPTPLSRKQFEYIPVKP